jgi:hypothetical protein
MSQCNLIYIFIACVIAAMLLDVAFFIMNKKNEMKKIKSIAREIRRSK